MSVVLRSLVLRWRGAAAARSASRSWRAAEIEQARADAAEQGHRLALLAVASGMDGMPGGCDPRGALLVVQWAIAEAARKSELAHEREQLEGGAS